jgi:hypothetical protein
LIQLYCITSIVLFLLFPYLKRKVEQLGVSCWEQEFNIHWQIDIFFDKNWQIDMVYNKVGRSRERQRISSIKFTRRNQIQFLYINQLIQHVPTTFYFWKSGTPTGMMVKTISFFARATRRRRAALWNIRVLVFSTMN